MANDPEFIKKFLRAALASVERGDLSSIICVYSNSDGIVSIAEGEAMQLIFMAGLTKYRLEHTFFAASQDPDIMQ